MEGWSTADRTCFQPLGSFSFSVDSTRDIQSCAERFTTDSYTSTGCTTLSSTWLNVVTVPELPVPDSKDVEFKCDKQHVNLGGRQGVCLGGEIIANQGPPLCERISELSLFVNWS